MLCAIVYLNRLQICSNKIINKYESDIIHILGLKLNTTLRSMLSWLSTRLIKIVTRLFFMNGVTIALRRFLPKHDDIAKEGSPKLWFIVRWPSLETLQNCPKILFFIFG